ncbi:MAG: rod shape-determining protein MreC [Acidobacteriota bacterium]
MAILDLRQRAGYLFIAVMLGHVLLISAQVNARTGVPILEAFTFGLFAEIQRVVSRGSSSVSEIWTGYIGLRRVNAENEHLRQQLAVALIDLQQQRALADQSRGLARLLELHDQPALKTTAAAIIADAAAPDFRTVTIDKGDADGVRPDMAVIAPAGVVGRVAVASGRAAKVQLLIDRNAAAGAIVGRSRAQGVVVGGGADERLSMEYVSETADIVVGDAVMTSGIDAIYPKGFVIGTVEAVDKNGPSYRRIVVRPAVDFHALEDVLIVLTPAARQAEGSRE